VAPHPRFHNHAQGQALARFGAEDDEVHAMLGAVGRKMLRRLCREAPGTFMHSLGVLGIMERAGYAPGPRERAAVLCHDIGKLIAPSLFAENASQNLGRPAPWVLAGHVDFGIAMGEDAELDELAMLAIAEHHGTQVIDAERGVRYRGHVPSLPFTCALMCADTAEAMISCGEWSEERLWAEHAKRARQGQFDLLDAWTCEQVTRDVIAGVQPLIERSA
jgi:hypothetical protein